MALQTAGGRAQGKSALAEWERVFTTFLIDEYARRHEEKPMNPEITTNVDTLFTEKKVTNLGFETEFVTSGKGALLEAEVRGTSAICVSISNQFIGASDARELSQFFARLAANLEEVEAT